MDAYSLLSTLPVELEAQLVQQGSNDQIITLTADSRKVEVGSLFVAIAGAKSDGHQFLDAAAKNGAVCLVVEKLPAVLPEKCTVLKVADTHKALGQLVSALYGHPADNLRMIAITGTNGKTTVSWMIEQMLQQNDCQVGVIGTINYRYSKKDGSQIIVPAPLTTPDPLVLQKLLREMVDQGVSHVIMETSSHALEQKRIQGVLFDVGIFTNLSRDHLDYHGSMEQYFAAKKILFTDFLKDSGNAVIVTTSGGQEDNWGQRLVQEWTAYDGGSHRTITCGLDEKNDVTARDLELDINGFTCLLMSGEEQYSLQTSLTGKYNVLNLLAAVGAGKTLGLSLAQGAGGLSGIALVPGRLERVSLPGLPENKQPAVFVDYAHTPDALQNVLQTLKELAPARLICVFGCGGDRDTGKRSLMGKVAGELADVVIATSDNPRSENPETILDAVIHGLEQTSCKEVDEQKLAEHQTKIFTRIANRKQAIECGVSIATTDDILVIAGKGHEDYQLIREEKKYFDDRICALNALLVWNEKHLLAATGGKVICRGTRKVSGKVSTDTRTIAEGDIFVALCGENFDGHDYVAAAVKSGAAAVIVHKSPARQVNNALIIKVQDTLQALGDLAGYRRRLLHGRVQVLALTGSSGKTTVKEMLAAICREHLGQEPGKPDPLLKTAGNFNNLVGLPLSLLPVNGSHKMAILEMGMNRPGEIERLCAMAAPDIGCIINVQAAHLEGLGSIEGVARAKGELFASMRSDSIGVVNLDDPYVRALPCNAATVVGFAVTAAGRRYNPQVKATRITNHGEQGMRFTLHVLDWKQRITLPVPGKHNVSNATAAAAIAHAAGIAPETIITGLESFETVDKRMQYMSLPGGVNVVNDCYNANPSSMAAALATMATFGTDCKRIALLGDMLELGKESLTAHKTLGKQVAEQNYDLLLVKGSFAETVAQGAFESGMADEKIKTFAETAEIVNWLYHAMVEGRITEGDWLLVKGSRGMQMEKTLQGLEQRFATGVERVQ